MEQEPLIPDAILPPIARPDRLKPNNGNGKPHGAVHNRNIHVLRKLAESHSVPLMERLLCEAEAGDMLAMKIIMDRIWPKPRTAPVTVDLPATQTPQEIRTAMHELLARVTRGEITTDDGASLLSMMRDIVEAHKVETTAPGAAQAQQQGDPRALLGERLAKMIEARRKQAITDGDEDEEDGE